MKLTGKNRSSRGKTCPSATLSTINPTWTDPATKRLSHGTAQVQLSYPGVEQIVFQFERTARKEKPISVWFPEV